MVCVHEECMQEIFCLTCTNKIKHEYMNVHHWEFDLLRPSYA